MFPVDDSGFIGKKNKEDNRMSRAIAIIGASYLQLPLIIKAKEMGYETHVFAWAANDVGETEADFFYPISITEKDEILEKCREIGICAICSIASDLAVETVNYIASKLGLVGNSLHSTSISTNKYLMRKAFFDNGDPSPRSILVSSESNLDTIDLPFPVIVKPTDRSGSRGVEKVFDRDELAEAVKNAIGQSLEKKAVVEEYVHGKEYSVEHISYKGVHRLLAVTKKYTTGEPHYIETGHLEPAPLNREVMEKIDKVISHALDSLEIEYGASHSEIKIDSKGDIRIIEIGARMGGDCIGSDLVMYSTGYDFVRMVIQTACGEKPDFTPVCEPRAVESLFIFSQSDLDEFNRLKEQEPEKLIRVADWHPEKMGHTTDSSNRAGCYIRYAD